LGQYLNYQQALDEQDPNRRLYLAIPLDAYDIFFILPFIQEAVQRHHLRLVVCNVEEELITKWQM
jgi:hypothetical protein